MELPVVLYGQQILWHTDAEPVVYHLVCHYVLNVFKRETMKGMISTCSGIFICSPK